MNGFRPEEIAMVQGRPYPTVGGRLRLAHEGNDKINIRTDVVHFILGQEAMVKAEVTTGKGLFSATGVATAARDPRLADAVVELAETRALARALRWAGFGFELGVEELGDDEVVDGNAHRQLQDDRRGHGHVQDGQARGNGNGHHTPATSAQRRAILSLANKLGIEPDAAVTKVFTGIGFDDLSLAQASQLIDRMRSKGGNGNGQTVHDRRAA